MEDFNFPNLLDQAKKIDEGLRQLSEKLQNPNNIGVGQNSHIRLDEIEREMTSYEEILDEIHASIRNHTDKVKIRNNQKKEFIDSIMNEINNLEEVGKEIGFSIPINELSRLNMDDISPSRSPIEPSIQETPISGYSLSRSSTPYL